MTEVFNLNTGENIATYSCSPESAVIAAFAQFDRKDGNTWDYVTRYGHLVMHGRYTVACGDYCARLA